MKARLVITFLSLMVLLVLGLLPTLASTPWGSQKLLKFIGNQQNVEISARSLSLSWFGPQSAEGLLIRTPLKNDFQVTTEKLSCPSSLFRLFFHRCQTGSIQASCTQLALESLEGQPIYFKDIQLGFHWPVELILTGEAAEGQFAIQMSNISSTPQIEASLNHFPTSAIDYILSLYLPSNKQVLRDVVGSTISLDLTLQTKDERQMLSLHAAGEHFSTDLQTQLKKKHLVLEAPAQVQFQITSELLSLFEIPLELTTPVPAVLEITSLQIPFESIQGRLILDTLPLKDPDLAALIGDRLTAAFNYQAPILTFSATTPTLALKESILKIDQRMMSLERPTQVQVAAVQNSWLQLPSSATFSIEELSFPSMSIKAQSNVSDLIFNQIPIKNAHLSLDLSHEKDVVIDLISSSLSATLKGNLYNNLSLTAFSPLLTVKEIGSLQDCHLDISYDFYKENGKAKLTARSLKDQVQGQFHVTCEKTDNTLTGRVEIEQFPSAFFDLFPHANIPLPFATLFGPTVTANAKIDLENEAGAVTMSLLSSNARLSVNGSIEEGFLFLSEPLYGQLLLPPEIALLLFKDMSASTPPLFSSQDPLTLEIQPEGTRIPLSLRDFSLLNIEKGRLEIGQILCSNASSLNFALSLLQQQNIKDLHFWFAPVNFSIANNTLHVERTEILMNRILEICLWGKINLPENSIRMSLGLPAETLKRAFGLEELPADYVLQLPIRGKIYDITIDKAKANKKISLLLLWQKNIVTKVLGKGAAGAVVSELVNKMALPDKDKQAPLAKHPFPWEKKKYSSSKSEDQKNLKFGKEEIFPLLKFL